MKTNKPLWKILSIGLLVMAIMGMAVPSSAAGRGTQQLGKPLISDPYLCQVYSPNASMVNVLNAVSAPVPASPTDQSVWAVGYVSNPNNLLPRTDTLTMRYSESGWSIIPSPNLSSENYLNSVSARTANDAWAVGYSVDNGREYPLIMRFTGTYWKIMPVMPSPTLPLSMRLNGVVTIGDKEVVAVGYYSDEAGTYEPLALYFDGASWTEMEVPMFGITGKLYGVASDGTGIWAVGSTSEAATEEFALLYHFDGKAWTVVAKGEGYLTGVAVSDTGVFVVGDVSGNNGKETLVMLYNPISASFDRVPSFNLDGDHNFLVSVVSDRNEVYAVGYAGNPGNDAEILPLVLRYDGATFAPLQTAHPTLVDKLAGVTVRNGKLWAVGNSIKGEFGKITLVLSNNCMADQ